MSQFFLGSALKELILCLSFWGHVSSSSVGLYHAVRVSKHDWETFAEAQASPLKAKTHFECALECQSIDTCCMMQFDGSTCNLGHELGYRTAYRFPVNSFEMSTENVLMRKELYLAGESRIPKIYAHIPWSKVQCQLISPIKDYTDQVPQITWYWQGFLLLLWQLSIQQVWWKTFSSTGPRYRELRLLLKIRPSWSSVPNQLPAALSPTPGQGSQQWSHPYQMVTPAKACHFPGSRWWVVRFQSTWSYLEATACSLPGGWDCTTDLGTG